MSLFGKKAEEFRISIAFTCTRGKSSSGERAYVTRLRAATTAERCCLHEHSEPFNRNIGKRGAGGRGGGKGERVGGE